MLVIVPEEAAIVRRAFKLYLRGMSMHRISAELEMIVSDVERLLNRWTYLGEVPTPRGWIKGKHEPIIDAATFSAVQELAKQRRKGGPRARDGGETAGWMLRDVARCAHCGARMSAAYGGPRGARRYYYRCSHHCRSLGYRANNGSHVLMLDAEEQGRIFVARHLASVRHEQRGR